MATWTSSCRRCIPFLAFPRELRRVIYTTKLDRVAGPTAAQDHQNRDDFPMTRPSKLLWLATCTIEEAHPTTRVGRGRQLARDFSRSRNRGRMAVW